MKEIKTKILNSKLPLVIEPTNTKMTADEFFSHLAEQNQWYKKQLLDHGGLLFRNFPIQSVSDFSNTIHHLDVGRFLNYIGGDSPRKKIIEGIYTSTEAPPSVEISLHNELSYVKSYPSHICFYCEIAPKNKGETIIADSNQVYQSIDERVRNRFIEKGLKYVSCYHYKSTAMKFINKSHKSWIDVFETEDRAEVERKCDEHEIEFQWKKNDWIQITQIRPAVIHHPQTGAPLWFNQAHLFDFNPKNLGWWRYFATKILYFQKHTKLHEIYFADGTKIPREDIYHILDALDNNTLAFPWQNGDVLILDNLLSMHGRASFSGPRRILTAMTG